MLREPKAHQAAPSVSLTPVTRPDLPESEELIKPGTESSDLLYGFNLCARFVRTGVQIPRVRFADGIEALKTTLILQTSL